MTAVDKLVEVNIAASYAGIHEDRQCGIYHPGGAAQISLTALELELIHCLDEVGD